MTVRDLVAQPGDTDLDIDVDGVTVTAVVVNGRELLIRMTGGFGSWTDTTGQRAEFPPGDDTVTVTEVTGTLILESADQHVFASYVSILETWRDRALPLRLCGAQGRMFSLIEDRDRWLPVPRNWPGDDK